MVPSGPYISPIINAVTCVSGSLNSSPFVSKSLINAFVRLELAGLGNSSFEQKLLIWRMVVPNERALPPSFESHNTKA